MGKQVRSARGEVVDFDLIKIKEQIASATPPVDVKQRQDFVERRLRRRAKKSADVTSGGMVDVEPNLPKEEAVDDAEQLAVNVDTNQSLEEKVELDSSTSEEAAESSETKTKQRARPARRKKKVTDEK